MGRITGVVIMNEMLFERRLRIQPTRNFGKLPSNVKSKEQNQRSKNNSELWLEETRIIIKTQDVIRHINI